MIIALLSAGNDYCMMENIAADAAVVADTTLFLTKDHYSTLVHSTKIVHHHLCSLLRYDLLGKILLAYRPELRYFVDTSSLPAAMFHRNGCMFLQIFFVITKQHQFIIAFTTSSAFDGHIIRIIRTIRCC